MEMFNPCHPGEILREDVLQEIGMSVTEAARRLGYSRVALSRVLHGRAAITADLADRLEAAGLSKARFWLGMQIQYDLAQLRKNQRPSVGLILEGHNSTPV